MSQRSLICVISALAIVFMAVPAQASEMERTILPAIGVIINPSGKNIAVRESPPEVSAFSYKLADRICSVGVGTVFEALKELKIVNGEVWYRIHIDRANVKNPIGWDRRDIDGWIAGRFRNRWAVSFLHEDIKQYANSLPDVRQTSSDYRLPVDRESLDSALPVPGGEDRTMLPDITRDTGDEPDSATDGTSAGTEGPAVSTGPGFTEQPSDPGIDSAAVADIAGPQGLKDDDSQGGLSFLLRYILLFAGSCTAVIVLAIERNQSLNIKQWFSPIIPFEFFVLGLANIVFVALLLNTFVKNSKSSVIFECITVFAGPNFGFIFIGFIIAVLLSKFMAFARK